MKKIFTIIATMFLAMSAMATDYSDKLVITVEGMDPVESTSKISINKQDNGKYTIMLSQFNFMGALLIGDVTMTDVEGIDDAEGFTNYATTQTATITNGDPEGIMGMLGGKIDVTVKEGSRSKDGKFYAVITLTVPGVGDVTAVFGDNNFPGSAGIDGVVTDGNKISSIYTLDGTRVNTMVRGINILKLKNGKTVKVMNNF